MEKGPFTARFPTKNFPKGGYQAIRCSLNNTSTAFARAWVVQGRHDPRGHLFPPLGLFKAREAQKVLPQRANGCLMGSRVLHDMSGQQVMI